MDAPGSNGPVDLTARGPGSQQVNLATVIASADGIVHFYGDNHRHDAALEKVLRRG